MRRQVPIELRFWSKVEVRGTAECWPWTAATDGHGYGAIAASGQRRTLQAHRVAYALKNGPIPDGLKVLHRCDNPACCNPTHLWAGTQADNMRDMGAKGRRGRSKLSKGDVCAIRRGSDPVNDLASRFGVTPAAIRQVRRGAVWAGVQ